MIDRRGFFLAGCVLATACGSPAEAPAPAPPPPVAAPAPVATTPIAAPTPTVPALRWPAPPTLAAVGGGCSAGTRIELAPAPAHAVIGATPAGALVAYADHDHVQLVALSAVGAAVGARTSFDVLQLHDLLGISRLGDASVLVMSARCSADDARLCVVAASLDASGVVGPIGRSAVGFDAIGYETRVVSSADGSSAWVATTSETSHEGHGVIVHRIARGAAGAPELLAPHRYADDLPEMAELTGFRLAPDGDELALLFGARLSDEYADDGRWLTARYLARPPALALVTQAGLGDVVHDLVLEHGTVHALFHRGTDYYAATLDGAGGIVGEPTLLDRAQPLPPPFNDRVLVEIVASDPPAQVLHDASGRRLGDAIPSGSVAWTGAGFLVASGEGSVGVTPVTCRPPVR